jgi:hypothetical protein
VSWYNRIKVSAFGLGDRPNHSNPLVKLGGYIENFYPLIVRTHEANCDVQTHTRRYR